MEFRAVTDLARIKASIMAGLVVVLGMVIASPSQRIENFILGFFVGFFVSSSTNTINDIMDRDIDLYEKPNRPIPRKGITIKEANVLFALETIFGLVLALYLNIYSFLLASSVAILSIIYSWKLKNILLVKNLITSFGISSALLVGVFATNQEIVSTEIFIFFILIFVVGVTFEIHKDIADVEWDGNNNKKTIPVVYGTRVTALVVNSLYFVSIILYHLIFFLILKDFTLLFWVIDIFIFIAYVPLLKLITQHDDIAFVHRTRKISMGVLMLITISLIVTFLTGS